jgi:hypothetical protein
LEDGDTFHLGGLQHGATFVMRCLNVDVGMYQQTTHARALSLSLSLSLVRASTVAVCACVKVLEKKIETNTL